jgi:hypothetical protein
MPAMPTNYTRALRTRPATRMADGGMDNGGRDIGREASDQGVALRASLPNAQPRRAASIAATSILRIVIIASNTRLATAGSGSV